MQLPHLTGVTEVGFLLFGQVLTSCQPGAGAEALAAAVAEACEQSSDFQLLYDVDKTIEEKIETICKELYGADGIEIERMSRKREQQLTGS